MGIRALCYKNMRLCWLSYIFIVIIMLILFSCVLVEKDLGYFAFIVLIAGAIAIGIDLRDEKSHSNVYYETLPISRTTHFINNMSFIVVSSVLGILMSLATSAIFCLVTGSSRHECAFQSILSGFMIGLGLVGILMVIKYKFGAQAAGIIASILGGLLGGFAGYNSGVAVENLEEGTSQANMFPTDIMFNLKLAAVGLVVFVLCMILAHRIYINKDI